MNKKIFRSRISILLILLVIGILFVPAFRSGGWLPLVILSLLILAFGVGLFSSIRYVINGHVLTLRTLGFEIGYLDIRSICLIKRTYNPLSSPAASLKRLAVYRKDRRTGKPTLCTLISPVREEEFCAALKAVNPMIDIKISNHKGWWRIWDWDI